MGDGGGREVLQFPCCLVGKQVIPEMDDGHFLIEAKDGRFTVKFMYKLLSDSSDPTFPFKFIWNPCVPSKIGFIFAWETSWGKILTLDQLKRRGRVLANRYFLCEEDEETVDYLSVHCPKTKILWDLLLAIMGVNRAFPYSIREVLLSWHSLFVGNRRKRVWMAAPFAYFGRTSVREIELHLVMRLYLLLG